MDMDFITGILSGIDNPIISCFILLLIVFVITFKVEIGHFIFRKKEKKSYIKREIADLRNHNVFTTLSRIKYEVANTKFYTNDEIDVTKTKMCEDFTIIKSNVCAKYMLEFLDYGIDTMDRDRLKKTIMELQIRMHVAYIDQLQEVWIRNGIDTDDVDYIVQLFETFRYDVVNSFEHRINAIFGSSMYRNNFTLTLAIFEMWAMGIDLLPRDMQTTFETLNGKFQDVKYGK